MTPTEWLRENGYEAIPSYNESSIKIYKDGVEIAKLLGDELAKRKTQAETLDYVKELLLNK